MAVAESLHQFRFAALFLAPWEYKDPKYSPQDLDENAERYWKLWLNPAAVEGLDPSSFFSLTPVQKADVEQSKRDFLANATGATTPTPAQLSEARQAFLRLFQLIGKYLFDPLTMKAAEILRTIVRDKRYGNLFVGVDFSLGEDSTGDPAIWAWMIVEDDTPADQTFRQKWSQLRQWIREDLRIHGIPDRIVYLHLRTVSEQIELAQGSVE